MNELRREMPDSSDAPAELSPDLKFLASRQASLAALMLDHAAHYKVLYRAARETGITEEIQAAALDAAGNLGTVLQSLRGREDLQIALAHAPGHTPTPMLAVDQLFFSFTLLAGVSGDSLDELNAALGLESVDELLRSQRVRDWLHGLGELAPGA
jgi:hypothetical protein